MHQKKPDFIIIGAAKSGTTSLYRQLSLSPSIFMSTPKEPEYFARDDVYAKGVGWYERLFKGVRDGQLVGEASTLYSLVSIFPNTVSRIHELLPDIKLIYLLRDPVQRAYSFYVQLIKNYQNSTRDFSVNRTFEECVFPDRYPLRVGRDKFFAHFDGHYPDIPDTFLGGGMYMDVINSYLNYFSKEKLHLIRFEDLIYRPTQVIERSCNFLGIDSNGVIGEIARENISEDHFQRADKEVYKQSLVGKLRDHPFVYSLSRQIPRRWRQGIVEGVAGCLSARGNAMGPTMMLPETESYLRNYYREQTEELEEFWGEDLSAWK